MTDQIPVPGPRNLITDVEGIKVGNVEDHDVRTGVTVILPDERTVAGGDVRGGGPGTRETSLLDPSCLVDDVDAIVLSGGSSYGLDAAGGVENWLGARGRGFQMASAPVSLPIVPAAILFDVANGGNKEWGSTPPYHALGQKACEAADVDFRLGNAGAGLGAQAGSVKGGLGSASLSSAGFQVGALMAVNSLGSTLVPGTKSFWAAPFELADEFGGMPWPASLPAERHNILAGTKFASAAPVEPASNTTIGVVAVNADLTPAECRRVAIMAHDGMARAIRPIHTPFDGDSIFVLATGRKKLGEATRAFELACLGSWAADCVSRAIARGVYEAETVGNMTAYRDL